MILSLFFLTIGLIALWFSGEFVVRYSLQLAYQAGLSTLFIGFFLISISTGLPELSVVINALWANTPALSVGDIVGSNFFDLAMGLGIPALCIRPILIAQKIYGRTLFMLVSTLLLMLFILTRSQLLPWHGFILVVMYCFINWLSYKLRGSNDMHTSNLAHIQTSLQNELFLTSTFGTWLKLSASIGMVLAASHLAVVHAITLATQMGYSIAHFGATFTAIGTSLPELTLSVTAIRNKEYSLAIGNCLGSIWDQGGLMMGLLALFSPQALNLGAIGGIKPFLIAAYIIAAFFIIQKRSISRLAGALLVSSYAAFMLYELIIVQLLF